MGRSDDMLIIRGVNVFPSQIEEVLIEVGGGDITPNYLIKIDRINNTDTFDLDVEMSEEMFSDDVKSIAKVENANFGDIVKQFAINMPAILEVLTLALLNDRHKIFKDGNERNGYSDLYYATFDTLKWECNVETFGNIFLEVLQMIDVSFFWESCRILEIFRESTMARKNQNLEQK